MGDDYDAELAALLPPCFICGAPGVMSYGRIGGPERWYCIDHTEVAYERAVQDYTPVSTPRPPFWDVHRVFQAFIVGLMVILLASIVAIGVWG